MNVSFHAVIPAGGSGTRLWPLSRAGRPKFLLPLGEGERSLLQVTVQRLSGLVPVERLWVVTGGAHVAAVARQLPDVPAENLLVEPGPRESAPAIGLAAVLLHRRDPASVMGSFASDHLVSDVAAFHTAVRTAIDVAASGALVTIGITPTEPETGYGYIRAGSALGIGSARAVSAFSEKPSRSLAESFVAAGDLWNASMFVWQTESLIEELAAQLPDLYAGLSAIADQWDGPNRDSALAEIWPQLPKISIDHGIMEAAATAGRVATVPAAFGWNDVGDWHGWGGIAGSDDAGNVVATLGAHGRATILDAADCVLVPASGRMLAVVGLRDVIIVDTDDAVLVCSRDRAQDVKALVAQLREQGDDQLL